METTCKNCNQYFKGNFCHNCGQSSHTHDVNFQFILHEIQHGMVHVDKGFFFTIKELFYRPGNTIREYLEGKRVKHFKPISFVLLLSTTYAILTHSVHQSTFLDDFFSGMTAGIDSNVKNEDKTWSQFSKIVDWLKNHYAYSILLFLPIMSLSSYLAFFKSKYNYFQHLVLNSYIAGQRTFAYILLLPISYFITDQKANDIMSIVKFLIGIQFTFWTYFQFFDAKKTFSKIFLTIISYLFLGFFSIAIIFTILGILEIFN
jgi:Protein of unknown function (DUF3667)